MRGIVIAVAPRVELPAVRELVLHAAVRSARPVCTVAAVWIGARRERREGESRAVPAGGSDQDTAGVFSGRVLHAELGAVARPAREALGPALSAVDRTATALACVAGDVRGGAGLGLLLFVEGPRSGARH